MQKLLFVETSATLRHVLAKSLKKNGYQLEVRNDFASYLEHLHQEHQNYDGLIIGWPEQNDNTTDELFALLCEEPYNQLPLIVLALDTDSAKLNWISSRPNSAFILWDTYEDTIKTLPKLLSAQEPESSFDSPIDDRIRILVVDDSPTARFKTKKLLEKCNYDVESASCSKEAFEKSTQDRFDIAIIDYFMPEENGDVLCKRLRSHPITANMILAVLTSSYSDRVIQSSLAAGASECMFKSEPDDLFNARVAAMVRTIEITKNIDKKRAHLDGILTSVGDGVYGVNNDGLITFINPAARSLLGFDKQRNLIGYDPELLFHKYQSQNSSANTADLHFLKQSIKEGKQLHGIESIFTRADGTPIQVELTIFPLTVESKQEGAVVAFRDISERKLLKEELTWQANHCPITNLPNRNYLEESLRKEVQRIQRSDECSAFLYIDLDRFTYINDTVSHDAGDKLLIEVSRLLESRLRQSDVLARLGGDEFGVLLTNISSESIENVAEQFRSMFDDYQFQHEDRTYKISASVGVEVINKDTQSHGDVFANADVSCHIAKKEGRNAVHVYTPERDDKATMDNELDWSSKIHTALDDNKFQLHFQPILSLHDLDMDKLPNDGTLGEYFAEQSETAGFNTYEVLLRMPDMDGKVIPPGAFLPTAERFNIMPNIDEWVINQTMQQMAELDPEYNDVSFTINLSGQSLDAEFIVPLVSQGMKKYNLEPSRFLFEITESSAINDTFSASRLIDELTSLGCRFALDDFGSGYCSFAHLKRLPVEYIKIDGMFVKDMINDPMDLAIVRSITTIAHSLGKQTIAEFVESPDVIKILKECGVDYIQGYYVAKPEPNLVSPARTKKKKIAS